MPLFICPCRDIMGFFAEQKVKLRTNLSLILISIKNQTSLCPTTLPTVSIRMAACFKTNAIRPKRSVPNVPNWYVSSSFPCREKVRFTNLV